MNFVRPAGWRRVADAHLSSQGAPRRQEAANDPQWLTQERLPHSANAQEQPDGRTLVDEYWSSGAASAIARRRHEHSSIRGSSNDTIKHLVKSSQYIFSRKNRPSPICRQSHGTVLNPLSDRLMLICPRNACSTAPFHPSGQFTARSTACRPFAFWRSISCDSPIMVVLWSNEFLEVGMTDVSANRFELSR
jgi:hypothetical protein